jgi:type II secretory pathway pseudopilin PulG
MKYHSKKIAYSEQQTGDRNAESGFSLVESVTALIILAFISSSVLVVINRCMTSAADMTLRMQAFEVARENMEALLSADSVQESTEYGSSDKYPQILWQKTVETFYEPITSRIWVQAICAAEYTDSEGEVQTIELTHWLTDLTKQQLLEMLEEKEKGREKLSEQIIEGAEDAAKYAGVDTRTILQWVENGMPLTDDGGYIKDELDFYKSTDGRPTIEDKKRREEALKNQQDTEQKADEQKQAVDEHLICGHTMAELEQMDFNQIWEILSSCEEF